ncbi:uncharacterized protein LOC143575325 [Bidens hawaiensis]|uniref:uncharacterized protein LOC143575325 n=1 Tax=Bidens hawaiensis TaxID=980011 RepID=UPI00404A6713
MSASAAKSSSRKKKIVESATPETELKRVMTEEDEFNFGAGKSKQRAAKKQRSTFEDDVDADLSSDIKGLMNALHQIKEKAQKDGQKKKEETISSVATEIRSKFDELKSKVEKERQNFARALSKSSKECENLLKNEIAKFQAVYENFCKDKNSHLQALNDAVSKYEGEKEKLFLKYEQHRKKEKNMIMEHEKACATKIAELEESLKKKKQDDKTFSFLRKTLGSFLDNASDEDFPADD